MFLSHEEIINNYNSIIIGYLNYYKFVDNKNIFNTLISYILKHSCAKTLARKFKLSSRRKVFQKYGPNLQIRTERNNAAYKLKTPPTHSQ